MFSSTVHIRNALILLRFPFSFFLLPVSLFSFYFVRPSLDLKLFLLVFIWHILIFPSSNAYNSLHDQDEGPIGGLAKPPKATKLLLHVSNTFDALGIILSFFVSVYFPVFVIVYVLASRAYSNKKFRLKKFPTGGFLIVFLFQGAWVFCANVISLAGPELLFRGEVIVSALLSSFLVGTIYPLTQIYQHEADANDGVRTLSMKLGIKGTFLFSALLFGIANSLIYYIFYLQGSLQNFWLFVLIMLPATLFFVFWTLRSFQNELQANFKNTMMMLVLSSILNNFYFILILCNSL